MPEERLTEGELAHLCFGASDAGDPDEVFGDEHGAVVMQVQRFGEHVAAWLDALEGLLAERGLPNAAE